MDRLTKNKFGELLIKNNDNEYRSPCFGCESINKCNPEKMTCGFCKALEKLAEYEDLEEQGKLLKLPCAVGDMVYSFSFGKILTLNVDSFVIYTDGIDARLSSKMKEYEFLKIDMDIADFGKKWFATQEEAEAALKELEGKDETD